MKINLTKNSKNRRIQPFVTVAGALVILMAAFFCYREVRDTIVSNEEENIISIAKVSAHSLETTLQAKSNLVYAALSGDMENEEDIRQNMLKVGEKARYISLEEEQTLNKWQKDVCEKARTSPGEVIAGPTIHQEEGHYALYLTKAVYVDRSIAGYVQVELNLDEIYEGDQALSNLNLSKHGYCVVKNSDGITIMANQDRKEEELELSGQEKSGCETVWSYGVSGGVPNRTRKLVAYDTAEFCEEEFILCVIEDYDGITEPIERIASYLSVLGMALLVWIAFSGYRFVCQQREEEKLKMELQYEKELNEANDALKNQENLMQKYNHSKTTAVLTGAIAHEFNNLMTPIVLYSELFVENEVIKQEMPDEVYELEASVKRCEELARQLLDYSRQGKAEKVLTDYNATFAVASSVGIVERLMPDNIKMTSIICKTNYYIRGQIGTLNQIILNLVTNAIHAIGEKDGHIKVQFGLSTESAKMVRLIIEDNGSGIPTEIRYHIFDPFFTTKNEKEGTGIGLTVVRRLVEEHGGLIRVKSKEGEGTTFIIEFPIIDPT